MAWGSVWRLQQANAEKRFLAARERATNCNVL